MSEAPHPVKPLGIFGVVADQWEFERLRSHVAPLVGALPEVERPLIAKYLRAGTIIAAIMSYSWDILGGLPHREVKRHDVLRAGPVCGAFALPGGLGIDTDGTYYWRADTAEYVEHYGVGLPEEFLAHGRALSWRPPRLSPDVEHGVNRYLEKHVRKIDEVLASLEKP